MHAFDFVMTLLSFVYALAITHVLATVGDIIGAWKRVRVSWLNAAWMLFSLFGVLAWWLGFWELHQMPAWGVGAIAIFFAMSCVVYIQVRLTCARIPFEGPIDLREFHRQEGFKYLACFLVVGAGTIFSNVFYFGTGHIASVITNPVNRIILLQCAATAIGIAFSNRKVQAGVAAAVGILWLVFWIPLSSPLS